MKLFEKKTGKAILAIDSDEVLLLDTKKYEIKESNDTQKEINEVTSNED